ncbi:MAG: response regulator [Bryobacteraceae bacterium]|nr:response regulator [Bryobacteraceae bacterium]
MPSPSASCDHSQRILIVDDNSDGLIARKHVLEELGFSTTTAGTAQEALEAFAADAFDLVVTDYRMPRMDGLEFIQHIRVQSPATRVILISGFAEALGLSHSNTGADVVIQKSNHEVSQLVAAVSGLLKVKPRKPVARRSGGHAAAPRARGAAG